LANDQPRVSGVAAEGVAGTLVQETPPLGAPATAYPPGQPETLHWANTTFETAAAQIAADTRGRRASAILATTGPVEPPFPPPDGNVFVSRPQEPPRQHRVVADFGMGIETQVETRRDVAVPLAASTTAIGSGAAVPPPAPITIVSTPYPREPGAPLVVNGSPLIDGQQLRELNAKLDQIIGLLAGSNQFAIETRNQLTAEIQAGKVLLSAPKPNTDLLKALLVHPLMWLASAAAGAMVGEYATEALHLIEAVFQTPIPM
jgi:hypothetical protein